MITPEIQWKFREWALKNGYANIRGMRIDIAHGEEFDIGDSVYITPAARTDCDGCILKLTMCCKYIACTKSDRKDGTDVIFRLVKD